MGSQGGIMYEHICMWRYSIDRAYRDLEFTWFEEEIPSQEEYEEAWKNLEECDYRFYEDCKAEFNVEDMNFWKKWYFRK